MAQSANHRILGPPRYHKKDTSNGVFAPARRLPGAGGEKDRLQRRRGGIIVNVGNSTPVFAAIIDAPVENKPIDHAIPKVRVNIGNGK